MSRVLFVRCGHPREDCGAYLRALAQRVEVDAKELRITGSKRELLAVSAAQSEAVDTDYAEANETKPPAHPCPCCGGRMVIIKTFQRGSSPRYRPAASTAVIRIDTS